MSYAMDKALMALSLEEEDEPFDMPDLPQYKSCERNSRSIIGRILNPDCQKMPGLIREMPRTWQKQGKVRGIALSKERFQFVFDHEHDLLEVLEKGVHTFNDWTLAIDRWVEKPPEDYLQFIPLWVQIRNLPVNYYTKEAITALGEKIGAVKVVAFDPDKPQVQDYVRIQVRFDVSRPLRKSKVVNLPEGGSAVVLFNYERIRKRCYECQRLNHEKDICPLLNRNRREAAALRSERVIMDSHRNEVILHQDDPLFGVLSEDQVGICKMTGRRKIAPEVLEEMRRYLLMATEEDKKIRIDRVRSSVAEAEKDPFLQKTMLRLETAPTFTNQIDKGKGVVYDFDLNTSAEPRLEAKDSADKLMASAIKANIEGSLVHRWEDLRVSDRKADLGSIVHQAFLPHEPSSSRVSERGHDSTASLHGNSTEYGPGYFVSKPSGVVHKSSKSRRRPYIKKRREQQGQSSGILHQLYGENEGAEKLGSKRKAEDAILKGDKMARLKESRVVPMEGPPKPQ